MAKEGNYYNSMAKQGINDKRRICTTFLLAKQGINSRSYWQNKDNITLTVLVYLT